MSTRITLGASLLFLVCVAIPTPGHAAREEPPAIADEPVARDDFATKATPARKRPKVASKGDCAPRYANGMVGTCIDNKPCRGWGVKTERGAECACFAKRGGCDAGYRCDVRAACVKEDVPDTNY